MENKYICCERCGARIQAEKICHGEIKQREIEIKANKHMFFYQHADKKGLAMIEGLKEFFPITFWYDCDYFTSAHFLIWLPQMLCRNCYEKVMVKPKKSNK